MRYNYLLICILALTLSCNERPSLPNSTYLAGEIVNPTAEHVVLLKGDQPVDTAYLNADNRFEFRFSSLADGLYNFNHHPEFQYVFLQKGDSMQIRLNTVAFDESLVFSGQGEEINNFLIDLYLRGEKEHDLLRRELIRREPEEFAEKLDSISELKLEELDLLQEEGGISSMAYETAEASIRYQNYFYREGYPFWHRKQTGDPVLHEMPEDFYAYRDQVSYANPNLTFLKPYYDFMIYHVGNLAFMGCQKKCGDSASDIKDQLHFSRHQLQLIDSLIVEQELKDNLFRTVAMNYLLKHDTATNFRSFMDDFHQRSGNNRHLEEIENLHTSIKELRPGNELPALPLISMSGDTVPLNRLPHSEDKVILYFWSGPQIQHLENIRNRIEEVRQKKAYEDYQFVGICLRTDQGRWKELVAQHRLDPEYQFWTEDFDQIAHTLVVYHPFKSIILENGTISDGFANLMTSFEQRPRVSEGIPRNK